jgi:hypothetical protein
VIKCTGWMLVLTTVILLAWVPVEAQAPDFTPQEQEWIAYVSGALANLNSLESYTIYGKQVMSQDITIPGQGNMLQDIVTELEWRVQLDGAGGYERIAGIMNMVTHTETKDAAAGNTSVDMTMVMESILLDDRYYLHYDITMPEGAGQNTNPFGDDWYVISLDDLAAMYEDIPGMEDIDIEALMELSGSDFSQYVAPVSEETVLDIAELAGETLGGREMRVFEIGVNYAEMLPDAYAELFAGLFAGSQMPYDNTDEFFQRIAEDLAVRQRVWIGVDDQLPYRVEQSISGDLGEALAFMFETLQPELASDISLQQTIKSDMTFADFNVPFEVEVPEDAVPFAEWMLGGF